jgi:hypothetical protein
VTLNPTEVSPPPAVTLNERMRWSTTARVVTIGVGQTRRASAWQSDALSPALLVSVLGRDPSASASPRFCESAFGSGDARMEEATRTVAAMPVIALHLELCGPILIT